MDYLNIEVFQITRGRRIITKSIGDFDESRYVEMGADGMTPLYTQHGAWILKNGERDEEFKDEQQAINVLNDIRLQEFWDSGLAYHSYNAALENMYEID